MNLESVMLESISMLQRLKIAFSFQGYFQTLFSCIERLLGFLNVENLVLPAAEEAESLWINKFGFTNMSEEQVCVRQSF